MALLREGGRAAAGPARTSVRDRAVLVPIGVSLLRTRASTRAHAHGEPAPWVPLTAAVVGTVGGVAGIGGGSLLAPLFANAGIRSR